MLDQGDNPGDSGNHDAQSTSSELLDLLLQEDARSGTGSNASGSGSGESGGSLGSGSGSNGTSTSHTGKRRNTHVKVCIILSFQCILGLELASNVSQVTNTLCFLILQHIANELSNQILLLQKKKLAVEVENNAKQKSNSLT